MNRRTCLTTTLLLALAGCGAGDRPKAAASKELMIFSASSLKETMAEIASRFDATNATHTSFSFAGSNFLAQQLKAAPKADVFISADESWMDEVEQAGLLVPDSRRTFLSNRLVIIVHRDNPLVLAAPAELASASFRHLSLADPESVPAGRYARQFLERVPAGSETLWTLVQDRVVSALDVRAALAQVEAQPNVIGIVYRTDARISDKVRVAYEVPEGSGPDIRYSAAAISGRPDPEVARRLLAFLGGAEATAVFEAQGFIPWHP